MGFHMNQNQACKKSRSSKIISALLPLGFLIITSTWTVQAQKRDIVECREKYENTTGIPSISQQQPRDYEYTYRPKRGRTSENVLEKHPYSCRTQHKNKPFNRHYVLVNKHVYWLKSITYDYNECASWFFTPCQGVGPRRTRTILVHSYTTLPIETNAQKFIALSDKFPYGTDGTYFYFKDKIIENISLPENIAAAPPVKALDRYDYYVIFDTNVIYKGMRILSADAKTFELMKNENFSRDKNQVYWKGKVLPSADSASFEVVNEWFAQDHTHVWKIRSSNLELKPLYKANIKNLNGRYSKNKTQVFYSDDLIKEADANSFEVLDLVCKKENSICGIDPKLLCPIPNEPTLRCGSEAGNNSLYQFTWAKDKNNVYNHDTILKNTDAKSFKLILIDSAKYNYAIDKNNFYDLASNRAFKIAGKIHGPIYRSNFYSSNSIFADEKGFFDVYRKMEQKSVNFCSNKIDETRAARGARGKLHAIKVPNANIAWAFEDDDFQYFFRNSTSNVSRSKSDKEHLNEIDYIIDKKSNIKYPMYWGRVEDTCKPIL
ncbi:hypothetical protein AwWohl_09860 [Gammaproteobacteria bacterium]|nr:hypothetical protein AwWohl_09860 [Gammaproteobacteria bacterium]